MVNVTADSSRKELDRERERERRSSGETPEGGRWKACLLKARGRDHTDAHMRWIFRFESSKKKKKKKEKAKHAAFF